MRRTFPGLSDKGVTSQMRVIIFAGHHKVGSTALQDFLARNALALARGGILYPAVEFEGMALMLGAALGRVEMPEVLPINAREPHNALAFRMLADQSGGKPPAYHTGLPGRAQMIRAIRKQVEFLNPDVVILAAEVFANFAPADPALITQLGGLFPNADITVIATLRRIDEYIASWHGQRLKFGHDIAPLRGDGMQGYFGNIHFDYRLMLAGWFDTLPDARFIIREYGEVRAAGGSVADFVTQTGLRLPDGLAPEQKTNESLHRGLYEIARRGNQALAAPVAKQLRQTLRRLTPELNLPDSGDIELFGAQNRAELVDRFEPIDAFLGARTGRPGFFGDLDKARKVLPIREMEVFRRAIGALLRRKGDIDKPDVIAFLNALNAEPVS